MVEGLAVPSDNPRFPGKGKKLFLHLFLWVIIPIVLGIYSLYLGKDVNWDFKNYHYYNAYAFLENRLAFDIAPAQLQTYFNPILDIPFFLLANKFSAATVGFVFGILHGFNLSLLFLIFWEVFTTNSLLKKSALGVFLVVVTITGPGFRAELGGTMNDNLISLFVLATILTLIQSSKAFKNARDGIGYLQVGMAGLLMGAGLGLKLAVAPIAISSGLMLPLLYEAGKYKIRTIGVYAIAGLLGFLASDGFWMWHLYKEFGNPLFPYYNHIFSSSFAAPRPFLDQRFLPQAWYEYLIWPILASQDSLKVSELKFSDLRFEFFYILFCFYLIYLILFIRKGKRERLEIKKEEPGFDFRIGNYLLAFFICSYIVWMISFSIYRYLIPLELLAPLCIILLLFRLINNRRGIILFVGFMLLIGYIEYQPLDYGRTDWSNPYVSVDTSQFETDEAGVVIMLGREPISYVIPEFPESFRFIRPESNLSVYGFGLFGQVKAILSETSDTIYILISGEYPLSNLVINMDQYGLSMAEINCSKLASNIPGDIIFCSTIKEPLP